MNMIDLMAICPFYISLILEGLEDFEIIGKTSKIIRLVGQVLIINILMIRFWYQLCGSTTFFVLISKMIRLVLIINDNSQKMIRLVLIIDDLVGVIILRCELCGFWGSSSWFVTLLDSSLCSTLCSKPTRCQEWPIISLWYFCRSWVSLSWLYSSPFSLTRLWSSLN